MAEPYSKELPNGLRVPSHSELYRDFHLIKDDFIPLLFDSLKLPRRFHSKTCTFEEKGWDIYIVFKGYAREGGDERIVVEYKSSIEEWGKQFDAYLRQMKKRSEFSDIKSHVALVSWDMRFCEFEKAAEMCGFKVIVLPRKLLDQLAGKNGEHTCEDCGRGIKQRGRCLPCNKARKEKRTE